MMKSIRTGLGARIGIAAVGVGLLTAVGSGVATAAPVGEDTVDVSVEIAPDAGAGVLALSVAGDAAALTEGERVGTDRVFNGKLPAVTVTDTRLAEDLDPEAFWYVVGSITDFTGNASQPKITSAEAFGWFPEIVSGNPVGEDQIVAPGDDVPPGTENGFVDEEILSSVDSAADAAGGAYTANADLTLRTPGTVAPGTYAATLTLSLFEG